MIVSENSVNDVLNIGSGTSISCFCKLLIVLSPPFVTIYNDCNMQIKLLYIDHHSAVDLQRHLDSNEI